MKKKRKNKNKQAMTVVCITQDLSTIRKPKYKKNKLKHLPLTFLFTDKGPKDG